MIPAFDVRNRAPGEATAHTQVESGSTLSSVVVVLPSSLRVRRVFQSRVVVACKGYIQTRYECQSIKSEFSIEFRKPRQANQIVFIAKQNNLFYIDISSLTTIMFHYAR